MIPVIERVKDNYHVYFKIVLENVVSLFLQEFLDNSTS